MTHPIVRCCPILEYCIRSRAFDQVYTGGICPLLWRPLVSLLALDIPAYRLDITAFAGLLNDGAHVEHRARLAVIRCHSAGPPI